MKKRVLLICPSLSMSVFKESKISIGVPHTPYVSLASLAGILLANNHSAKILDLSISEDPLKQLFEVLDSYRPDYVGVTFTTGLLAEAGKIAEFVKRANPSVQVIAGGVHSSIFPKEVLDNYEFDYVVFGEGEMTLLEIVDGCDVSLIKGIGYKKKSGEVVLNEPRELIEDLDSLPYPAFYLYDSKKYHSPKITVKRNPVIAIETSRGCPGNCIFCNKKVFQRRVRTKSAPRVVDEMEIVLNLGYKEIHIWDDCFSANLGHAKAVCDEILRRKLKICWNVYCGFRVDRVDKELLVKLKQSGCYRISYGIESGVQQILNNARKGITVEQIKEAVKMAKEANIEVLGFFMIGLPGETEETINKTIEFAKKLDVDLPKVGIATPLPGTEFFDQWKERRLLLSDDWRDYIFHGSKRIANYPGLKKDIFEYYNLFWRRLYLNPRFIAKRFWRGMKTGEIFYDAYYFLKILFKFGW